MTYRLICADVIEGLKQLPDESVDCIVTSPPYFGLRCYGIEGQLGLEAQFPEYLDRVTGMFDHARRVLKSAGTCWINLGDSYANDGKWGGHTGGKHAKALHALPIGRNKRYTGLKPKDLIGVPWKVAFSLQSAGWWLRSDIVWEKTNPMPESVRDRPTKSHEYIFLLTKSARYHYDADAIKEPASQDTHARYARGRSDLQKYADGGPGNQTITASFRVGREGRNSRFHQDRDPSHPSERKRRVPGVNPKAAVNNPGSRQNSSFSAAVRDIVEYRNKRSVWSVATQPFSEAHFATFPENLITPCILAGCPEGGTVLDPFAGSGTTGVVALRHNRRFIGIDLNPEYIAMARRRIHNAAPLLNQEATA